MRPRPVSDSFVIPDPFELLFEADLALAGGARELAIFLIEEAYEAFDVAEAINEEQALEAALP